MRTRIRVVLLGVTALTFTWPGMAPAGAEAAFEDQGPHGESALVEHRPAIADFEGRDIDLAGDWGDARACLVWRQGGVLRCFRTPQAMEAFARKLGAGQPSSAPGHGPSTSSAASYSCSSSLRLYEHAWYGGRELWFWDRGFWQNLWDYGFDNRTSGYSVGGCYVHLAEYANGGGWWYGGPTYPYAGEPALSWSWDNRISSIYIE